MVPRSLDTAVHLHSIPHQTITYSDIGPETCPGFGEWGLHWLDASI